MHRTAQRVIATFAFLAFSTYSLVVVANHSYFGFLAVPARGGWSLQVFLDLCSAATCFWILGVPDARKRGINPWPYVLATPFLGSIVIYAYFVHRSFKTPK